VNSFWESWTFISLRAITVGCKLNSVVTPIIVSIFKSVVEWLKNTKIYKRIALWWKKRNDEE
jgi:hypothetical protein